jgi:hypothetical protein
VVKSPDNWRCEQKFLTRERSLAEVLALVWRHPAAFREIYVPRDVNNTYLDSPELRDYSDHVNGTAHRLKTRVRWYGPPSGLIAKPALERKIKRGSVGGKVVHRLPAFPISGRFDPQVLNTALDLAGLPELLRLALHHLHPTLFNRYRRHYFLSADGRFRLTVDSDLQFFNPEAGTESMRTSPPRHGLVVMELKFGPEESAEADRVTNVLPFRLTRCSKYVLGIESLGLG